MESCTGCIGSDSLCLGGDAGNRTADTLDSLSTGLYGTGLLLDSLGCVGYILGNLSSGLSGLERAVGEGLGSVGDFHSGFGDLGENIGENGTHLDDGTAYIAELIGTGEVLAVVAEVMVGDLGADSGDFLESGVDVTADEEAETCKKQDADNSRNDKSGSSGGYHSSVFFAILCNIGFNTLEDGGQIVAELYGSITSTGIVVIESSLGLELYSLAHSTVKSGLELGYISLGSSTLVLYGIELADQRLESLPFLNQFVHLADIGFVYLSSTAGIGYCLIETDLSNAHCLDALGQVTDSSDTHCLHVGQGFFNLAHAVVAHEAVQQDSHNTDYGNESQLDGYF